MNKDYLTSPFNDEALKSLKSSMTTISKALEPMKEIQNLGILNSTINKEILPTINVLSSIPTTNNISASIASLPKIDPEIFASVKQLTTILSESQINSVFETINRNKSILQELQTSFASLYTSGVFSNPSLISSNPTLDDELIDNWNETSKSNEDRENFNSNEFKNNQVEQEPNRIVNDMTIDLNSKVEKLDKGFFHGLITPFATKEEFGRYVSQEIISLLLNIIMTYAITVGVADAEKMAKVMILSIKNRLKH